MKRYYHFRDGMRQFREDDWHVGPRTYVLFEDADKLREQRDEAVRLLQLVDDSVWAVTPDWSVDTWNNAMDAVRAFLTSLNPEGERDG